MNKYINHFLQGGTLAISLLGATLSHADVVSMSKVYSKPESAPQVQRCKGNTKCNAFYALAKDWQSIPNNFKLDGINVKSYAKDGDGYGLWKGFTLNSNRTIALANAGDTVFFKGGDSSKADERIYAQGMAVLLYLENKSAR
ncbi:hypothetical protein [Acinetobacter seifertii]|uniref:hypothetical protein n=1 Tax=Acinetobacter seifertii TaxID=1530123 RepID=UPI001580D272|nr:hypothetical protein [Acinetobacter seifertii]NUF83079.1 hypothetical protein [Acinetobacter seifertii]